MGDLKGHADSGFKIDCICDISKAQSDGQTYSYLF